MSEKTQTADNSQLEPKANQNPVEDQETPLTESPGEVEETTEDIQEQEVPVEMPAETDPKAENTETSTDPEPETSDEAGQPEDITVEEKPEVTEDVPAGDEGQDETGQVIPEELPEELPGEIPGEQPVEQPVEMPAELPEELPVETPEEKAEEEDAILSEAKEEENVIPGETKEEENVILSEAKELIDDEEEEVSKDKELIQQLNELEGSAEHEEEEEEEEEEEHAEPVEKYEDYSREVLLNKLEEVVAEQDIQKIKTRVALIKVAFLRLTRDEQQARMEAFIKEGGTKETFDADADALLDRFNQIFDVYRKNKARYNEEQEVQKLRNLDSKKQILEELKNLINSDESLKKTYDRFKELQVQWKEIGLVPSTEINNLWQNYHFLVEKFFDKVKISKELRDLDLKKNMEMKIELCEKAEELLIEPSILKSFKQLQKYHEEWKEIGPVPADKRDEIWERFKTATDRINERRREHYNSLTEQREENFKAKEELCDQAEQVVSREANTIKEWQETTRQINELFAAWKNLGPASKKENDEVWERFKSYLNTFFSNKKEYFGKLKQEQLNNFNLKLDICKQAENLKDSTDWKETTRELIELQKEWKKIGPVPRKHSDKIWKRFRTACDEFFEKKSEHFGSLQKNEKENLDKKLELINRLQGYDFGSNKSENLQVIKEFQREWMEIGHVPIKEKDKVQKAFREAINQQLDALKIHSSEIRVTEHRPRFEHPRDHDRGEGNTGRREMGFLTGRINQLKEDIQLWENNIGFLANSKRAELVRKEFEDKIEKAKEELAANIAKLRQLQEAED